MPEISVGEILGNLMIMAGDIFILLGLGTAALALFYAILGKWSSKVKQQKYDLQYGIGAIFLFSLIVVMFIGKLMTAGFVGLQNGIFFGFSDSLTIILMVGITLLLIITAIISFSGNTKS